MRATILVVMFLTACQSAPAFLRHTSECPEGYVPVDTAGGTFRGRAVSAGGVVIAMSERANDQQATLDFWASVIQKELTERQGYALKSTKKFKGGRVMVLAAPQETAMAYYLAIFVTPARITIVEIAGPQAEMDKDLPRLEEYIAKLKLG